MGSVRAIGIPALLTWVLVALAAAQPAGGRTAAAAQADGAAERFCVKQVPPEKPRRIDGYIRDRKLFGFRADEAYVRRLVRKGMWDSDVGWIPVTPREAAYLRLRDRLELGATARRYLRAHEDLDGGLSVEDDWPRGPYLLQRLTRDRAHHARALRRLARFPGNLRTSKVELSYRQLRRLQRRIDFDAHVVDGFHISSTSPDIRRNVVKIGLITTRSDHREYFRARYGAHVRTHVIGTSLTTRECAEVLGWRPGATAKQLEIFWQAGGGGVFAATEVVELPDRVEVAIVADFPTGFRTADWRAEPTTISLATPLGDRPIVSTTTGTRVARFEDFAPSPDPGAAGSHAPLSLSVR